MRWLFGIFSMALSAPCAFGGCTKTPAPSLSAADADIREETSSPGDATLNDAPPAGSTPVGASEAAADDGGSGAAGGQCVPATLYAAAEPCPPIEAGAAQTTFSCDLVCYSEHRILNGPFCAVGGFAEAGPAAVIPVTEAGTVVLCCPGTWDAAVPCEWFPKQ